MGNRSQAFVVRNSQWIIQGGNDGSRRLKFGVDTVMGLVGIVGKQPSFRINETHQDFFRIYETH